MFYIDFNLGMSLWEMATVLDYAMYVRTRNYPMLLSGSLSNIICPKIVS
jgi:hypothetical protein